MTRIIETIAYKFDELGDSAKERAMNWWREAGVQADEITNYDDWETIAKILGIAFDYRSIPLMSGKHGYEPVIYWSGFCSQGSGARFEGSYSYAKGAPKAIRQHAPNDTELARIADSLQSIQRRYFYKLEARMSAGPGSNFYSHSGCMSVDVEHCDDSWRDIGDASDDIRQLMRDFADWIYSQLEAQYNYLMSDESVSESIRCNEYEFDEEGNVL